MKKYYIIGLSFFFLLGLSFYETIVKKNNTKTVPRPSTVGPRPNIPNPNIKNSSQIV